MNRELVIDVRADEVIIALLREKEAGGVDEKKKRASSLPWGIFIWEK